MINARRAAGPRSSAMLASLTPELIGSRREGARARAALLLLIAGLAYAGWLVELVVPGELSSVDSYVSERFVENQPHHVLFRATDLVAGLALIGAALSMRPLLPRVGAGRLVWGGLAVTGLATIVDVGFVPDCVASVDRLCQQRELSGQVSAGHLLHLVSSGVVQAAVLVTWVGAQRLAVRAERRARRTTGLLGLTVLTAGVASLVLYGQRGAGLAQRVELLVVSAGWCVGAWTLHRARTGVSVSP